MQDRKRIIAAAFVSALLILVPAIHRQKEETHGKAAVAVSNWVAPVEVHRAERTPAPRARVSVVRRARIGRLVLAEWTKVAVCEEGGWVGWSGPAYPDSLGITARNWETFGGGADVSPQAQIEVATKLMASVGAPGQVPDQHGCAPW